MDGASSRPMLPPGPYLVAGLGRAGVPAARRLAAIADRGTVAGWDSDSSQWLRERVRDLRRDGVRVHLGGNGVRLLAGPAAPRCLIKSPGIEPTVPLLREAKKRGIVVIDELELGWRLDRRPVVAVTGTNGKSTVSTLAVAVLEAGGSRPVRAGNVYPGPAFTELQPTEGDVVVCEVSSFQLEGSPAFLPEVAVFTNLSHEHLDRHLSMRRYAAAKRRMFVRGRRCSSVAVVNVDDRFGAGLAAEVASRGGTVLRYGTGAAADYRLANCRWEAAGAWLSVRTPRGVVEFCTRLSGRHNAYNSLAALALADALDVAPERATAAIGACPPVPGRFEVIEGDQPFDVIVDYAHNPDGVRRALEAGRAIADARDGARLRVVFSTRRIRTELQRRMMARIAASLADHLVLTTERWPETDGALALPEGMEAALVRPRARCEIVLDRGDAIACALRAAEPADVVMILGRGNLAFGMLDRDGRVRPFDDRVKARELLASMRRAGDQG